MEAVTTSCVCTTLRMTTRAVAPLYDRALAEVGIRQVGYIGLGRQLVRELERQALAREFQAVRLDTQRVLTEAIGLYRSVGYQQIPAYDDNPHAHLWFEKPLQAAQSREAPSR
jgi:hypothetical protein